MQLAILVAILAALASLDVATDAVTGVAWRLLIVCAAPLGAPLVAAIGGWSIEARARWRRNEEFCDRNFAKINSAVAGAWLAGVLLVLLVAQWPQIVAGNWQLGQWPLVDELVTLAPLMASLFPAWAALYWLERRREVSYCERLQVDAPQSRLKDYLWLQVRHQLGMTLLPPLAIVALFETLAAVGFVGGNLDSAWWLVLPALATMLVLLPLAVRRTWRTSPLEAGPLRDSLEAICRDRNCRVQEILVWHTGGTVANAAVVGFSPWLRYLLLSDALLATLTPAEVSAVVRHEVAHLRRWHLSLRLALLLLPMALLVAAGRIWPGGELPWENTELAELLPTGIGALTLPFAMMVFTVVIVGRYSKLLEYDADLEACLGDNGQHDPQRAADFCRALCKVCGGSSADCFSNWLHPSLDKRLHFLARVELEQRAADGLRRALRGLALAMAAAYGIAAWALVAQ